MSDNGFAACVTGPFYDVCESEVWSGGAAGAVLPHRHYGIATDLFVRRHQRQPVDGGLADEHAVERVLVKVRQLGQM